MNLFIDRSVLDYVINIRKLKPKDQYYVALTGSKQFSILNYCSSLFFCRLLLFVVLINKNNTIFILALDLFILILWLSHKRIESGSTARNPSARISTFFRNLDCSTEKWHLLDRKKYAVRTYVRTFEQLIKKSVTARNFEQLHIFSSKWQNYWDSKI